MKKINYVPIISYSLNEDYYTIVFYGSLGALIIPEIYEKFEIKVHKSKIEISNNIISVLE